MNRERLCAPCIFLFLDDSHGIEEAQGPTVAARPLAKDTVVALSITRQPSVPGFDAHRSVEETTSTFNHQEARLPLHSLADRSFKEKLKTVYTQVEAFQTNRLDRFNGADFTGSMMQALWFPDILLEIGANMTIFDVATLLGTCTHLRAQYDRGDFFLSLAFRYYTLDFWKRASRRVGWQPACETMKEELARIERFQCHAFHVCGRRWTEADFFRFWQLEGIARATQ